MKLSETLEGVLRWLSDNAHALETRAHVESRPDEETEGIGGKIEELTESIRELRREMAELKSDRDSIEVCMLQRMGSMKSYIVCECY